MTFNKGDKVVVKGVPHDHRRLDQRGTVNYRLPYERHYYSVSVNGFSQVVNDSMMEHAPTHEQRITT